MRKSNKNIIDKIEIKSIEIENQYNKIFDSFLNLNINNKTLASYFKKNKSNFLLQTDICEKNLYKQNYETIEFLKFLLFKKKKSFQTKKIFFIFEILFIFIEFFKSLILFFRYFFYCFFMQKNNKLKLNKYSFDSLFFSYSIGLNFKKPQLDSYWGNIRSSMRKKSAWIYFSYINKKSIKEFNIKKLKNLSTKKTSFFALEQLIEKKSFILILLNYLKFFFQNLILYFILKQKVKKNYDLKNFFNIYSKILINSFFGRSLMRSLIYDQHFKFIISKFNVNKYFYLKENLNWEKTFKDNLNNVSTKKEIYGYVHTPVRYWDLKLNKISETIHQYPIEKILVSTKNCIKLLILKSYKKKQINLVRSLRFIQPKKKIKKFKKNNYFNHIILFGSLNHHTTNNMLRVIKNFQSKFNKNIKITFKNHPASIPIEIKEFNKPNKNFEKILNKENTLAIVDADSSISLNLILNKIPFIIYKDKNSLNTSFLRNNKNYYFFKDDHDLEFFLKNKKKLFEQKINTFFSKKSVNWNKFIN